MTKTKKIILIYIPLLSFIAALSLTFFIYETIDENGFEFAIYFWAFVILGLIFSFFLSVLSKILNFFTDNNIRYLRFVTIKFPRVKDYFLDYLKIRSSRILKLASKISIISIIFFLIVEFVILFVFFSSGISSFLRKNIPSAKYSKPQNIDSEAELDLKKLTIKISEPSLYIYNEDSELACYNADLIISADIEFTNIPDTYFFIVDYIASAVITDSRGRSIKSEEYGIPAYNQNLENIRKYFESLNKEFNILNTYYHLDGKDGAQFSTYDIFLFNNENKNNIYGNYRAEMSISVYKLLRTGPVKLLKGNILKGKEITVKITNFEINNDTLIIDIEKSSNSKQPDANYDHPYFYDMRYFLYDQETRAGFYLEDNENFFNKNALKFLRLKIPHSDKNEYPISKLTKDRLENLEIFAIESVNCGRIIRNISARFALFQKP